MAAGNIVGQVQVLVLPDGSMFTPQLNAILNQATNQAGAAGVRIGQTISQGVTQGTQQIGQSIDRDVTQRFFQAAASATAFTGAVMGTRAIIEKTVGKLAGLYDQLAQAQAGFTAIVGEKAGGKLLDEIRQFAKESPFVTQQLVNYSQQLLGVGMASEKIVPLLKDTGNVIASVGGDTQNLSRVLFALTQIKTVGRLMGQDAMQLQSALIPITKMLSEFLGKSTAEVKKMQEQGRISADMVFSAIQMAGSKVPHAMDNAVKNIAGARAVLSDTITIMMQDSPKLRAIYDDIVLGIQKFAAKLGEPRVQGAIQEALSSIGEAYEAIKPLILSMMKTLGEGSISGFKAFALVMESLAGAINAIPKPALDMIAKTLASIAMLKAPMMLMNYVKQFQTMAEIFKVGGGSAGFAARILGVNKAIDGTATATQAGARSTQRFTTAIAANASAVAKWTDRLKEAKGLAGKWSALNTPLSDRAMAGVQNFGSMGLMAAGSVMASSGDAGTQAGGKVAQYAGMGMMFGGPVGAVGAAAVAAVTSVFDAQEQVAEEHRLKMEEIAHDTAQSWVDSWNRIYGEGSGKAGVALKERIDFLSDVLDANQRRVMQARAEYDRLAAEFSSSEGYTDQREQALLDEATAKIDRLQSIADEARMLYEPQRQDYQNIYDETYGPAIKAVQEVYAKLPEDIQKRLATQIYKPTSARQGPFTPQIAEVDQLEKVLSRYRLTLQETGTIGNDEVNRIILAFENLSTAQQKAIGRAVIYNEAAKKAKETAAGIYGVQSEAISVRLASLNAEKSALEASTKAYENQGDETAQLQAQQAALNAQTSVYVETMARVKDELKASGVDETAADLQAQAAASKAAEEALRHYTIVAKGSVEEMSKKYGIASQQLQRILGLEGEIKSDLKIYITAEVEDAIKKILVVDKLLESLRTGRPITATGPQGGIGAVRAAAEREKARLEEVIKQYTGIGGGSKGGGGGGGGQSFADKVKSAAAALENAIKSAMQSVEAAADAWKSTIKQRVQYEQAVSAGRALSNVQRQMQDITFLRSGIAQLKTMGLSETAIAALDINALTDVRQVKKLLGSSPAQLAELSKAISERDKLAGQLSSDRQQEQSRKTIVLAIVEAAGILGYKVSEAQAKQIAATFNINATTDVTQMINDLLRQLSGGKVSL